MDYWGKVNVIFFYYAVRFIPKLREKKNFIYKRFTLFKLSYRI